MARHGYRGDGAYGQFCVVLPEQNVVVAITGASVDMQAVLDGLWTHLLPALTDDHRASPDRTAADLHLARRMTSLMLPAAAGKPAPEESVDRWDGAVFRPAGGGCEAQRTLQSVELHELGDGWQITLVEADHRLSAILTGEGWHVTDQPPAGGDTAVPVAASGGWDAGRLVAEIQFLETPHRLRLSCDLDDGLHRALGHGAAPFGHPARPQAARSYRSARTSTAEFTTVESQNSREAGDPSSGARLGSSVVARVSTASSITARSSRPRSIRRSRTATSCSTSSPVRSTAATR